MAAHSRAGDSARVTIVYVEGGSRRSSALTGALVLAAGGAVAAGALAAVATTHVPTMYAKASLPAAATFLGVGLALIAGGTLATLLSAWRPAGLLLVMLGAIWLAPAIVGWSPGPDTLRSVAALAPPFTLVILAALVATFPRPRPSSAAATGAVIGALVLATAYSLGRALVRDPFLDARCWDNCSANHLLLRPLPDLVPLMEQLWLISSGVLLVGISALAGWRLLRASQATVAVTWPVLLPAVVLAVGEFGYALTRLVGPIERPNVPLYEALFYARAGGLALLGIGAGLLLTRSRLTRRALGRLALDLGAAAPSGSLEDAMRRSLGDPSLTVVYRLADSDRAVDAGGRPVDLDAHAGRAITPITRSGAAVALVLHDPVIATARDLQRELGSAARMALDNERLRAELLAQLEDLRASRVRIVESADGTRRQIERDLHDGAQQRLLALLFDLRQAHALAEAGANQNVRVALERALADTDRAIDGLRQIAHGIYPVVLQDGGLKPALDALRDQAALVLRHGGIPNARLPEPIENAAYYLVREAVLDAQSRGAKSVSVEAHLEADRLHLVINDDGNRPAGSLVHVADRLGSVGGNLFSVDQSLRAELPCA